MKDTTIVEKKALRFPSGKAFEKEFLGSPTGISKHAGNGKSKRKKKRGKR